ncbi:MAG: hypothetical protein CMF05_11260 [Hyphomonas sp.]|nr:ATP-binding protein [Hyphomonas sp.]MAM08031.1 hypothetical protein [Hyphomonas sp.]
MVWLIPRTPSATSSTSSSAPLCNETGCLRDFRISVRFSPSSFVSCGARAIWMRVEDQGPGIEREHLPRLGERFYRADQSRGGKITGTGLGLAIVKHIMAHHRGGFSVETRIGEGSAFGVWLPAAREDEPSD